MILTSTGFILTAALLGFAGPPTSKSPAGDPARPAPSSPRSTSTDTSTSPPTVAPSPDGPTPGATAPDEGPEEVTRYQFTGLDIDGELRTPALLQFLTRIAEEFETMGIPHRSFMPELARTAHEDAL